MNDVTDYTPGDDPVPVGRKVQYFGSQGHGQFEICEHRIPAEHPGPRPKHISLETAYPDGTAYILWPLGMAKKFGNRDYAVGFVRRTSFRLLHSNEETKNDGQDQHSGTGTADRGDAGDRIDGR